MTNVLSTAFIADFFERSRLLFLALLVAISAVAVWGHFPDSPQVAEESRATSESAAIESRGESDFEGGPGDCLLVVEMDVFTPRGARAAREIVQMLEDLDYVQSVFWLEDAPPLNLFGLADPILPPDDASPQRFAIARDRALEHPLVGGQLLSADGKNLLMFVRLDWVFVTSDEACTTGLLETAQRVLAQHESQLDAKIQLTGRVPLFLAAKQAYDRNDLKFRVIAYSMVLLLAMFIFRGFSAVVIVAGAPALGIFWSLGILKLIEDQYNPLTNSVLPVLISMVGLTDGVHLMVHIRRLRAGGASAMESAKSAITHVGLACFLTSLTTAIGFGSLLLAHHELVRGFGRACAIGVMLTFIAVVTFIPLACTTRLGRNVHRGHEHDIVGRNVGRLAPLIDWVIGHSRFCSLLGILLTVLLGVISLTLRPDDRTGDSQPTGSAAYRALRHCDQAFGGIEPIQAVVRWPEQLSAESPLILAAVTEVEQVINEEPLVQNPLSIRGLVDSLAGQSDLESRMSHLALLPEELKRAYFKPEAREAPVKARIRDLGIAQYVPVFERIESRLAELSTHYPGFEFYLIGGALGRSRDLYQIVLDLAKSLGTASIIIFVVMALVYRSLRIGLITIVPNMFPLAVTATGLVLAGKPLDISGVCAFTICLGIAVDDTIHYLTRYHHELLVDGDQAGAIRRSFYGVGAALIMTTVVLVAGFGTVLTSDLPGQRTFAWMACSTIGAALVGDLLFLPAMLLVFGRENQHSKASDGQRGHQSMHARKPGS